MRLSILLVAVLLAGCDTTVDPPPQPPQEREPATFRVTLDATWSAETHPDAFPPNPHFSRLTGAVHAPRVALWANGAFASDGIREMAETGATARLRIEVETFSPDATFIEGGPIRTSPGTATVEITASEGRPFVTLVSMLAPSPDWFVGVSSLDLRDGGGWADRVEVPLEVYDAGTDDGDSYTAPDSPSAAPSPVTTSFYAPLVGTTVGTLIFERVGE